MQARLGSSRGKVYRGAGMLVSAGRKNSSSQRAGLEVFTISFTRPHCPHMTTRNKERAQRDKVKRGQMHRKVLQVGLQAALDTTGAVTETGSR